MIKINLDDKELAQLNAMIQKEVEKSKKTPLKRKKHAKEEKKHYIYSDLIQYNDKEFIKKIYQIILNREADADGFRHYLELLRSGKKSKSEIISLLRYSKEGKKINRELLGAKKRYLVARLFSIPYIGYISKILWEIIRLPKRAEERRQLQIKEEEKQQLHLEEERRQLQIKSKKDKAFNDFYLAFENEFRGSSQDIKNRLSFYLPYIQQLEKNDFSALDLGCGRGEWLDLLREHGYVNAKGIDINSSMIAHSRAEGFDVEECDLLDYLEQQKDSSLTLITGFHIIEHLALDVLLQLYKESYRVLKPGGMILFETPNPENIAVGACNFYTDPTHRNPLPPVLSDFMATNAGFKSEIVRLHLAKEAQYLEGGAFADLNDLLYAFTKEQDYAIVGYKS